MDSTIAQASGSTTAPAIPTIPISSLRLFIQQLSEENRRLLTIRTEHLFNQLQRLQTDDEIYEIGSSTTIRVPSNPPRCAVKQGTASQIPVALVVGIVNDYHSLEKPLDLIMSERQLECFQVVKALCGYVFHEHKSAVQAIDMTRVNQFLCLEAGVVKDLANLFLTLPEASLTSWEVCTRLLISGSYCIVALTALWLELKCPKFANLIEAGWPKVAKAYPPAVEEAYGSIGNKLARIFHELSQEGLPVENDRPGRKRKTFEEEWGLKLDREQQLARDHMEGRTASINKLVEALKALDQTIHARPALEKETILSDSFDSGNEVPEPTAEEDVDCVAVQKATSASWMKRELNDTSLFAETKLVEGDFCFARIAGKLISETGGVPLSLATSSERFIMCKLLSISADQSLVRVRCASAAMQNGADPNIRLSRTDLAVGHPPSVRCPEGTRVIARYKPLLSTSAEAVWLPGTVAVRPMSTNRSEYLVFFDRHAINGYVRPEDIRLLLEQPTDQKTGRFEPHNAYSLIERVNSKKAAFLRNYLRTYPDWPLIRLKRSSNTMRVLASRAGRQESAFVLDVDRHMCLLRFPTSVKINFADRGGKDCVNINCRQHPHFDEWVYRGDTERFPTLQQQANTAMAMVLQRVRTSAASELLVVGERVPHPGTNPTNTTVRQFLQSSRSNRMQIAGPSAPLYKIGYPDNIDDPLRPGGSREVAGITQRARKSSARRPAVEYPSHLVASTGPSQPSSVIEARKRLVKSYELKLLKAPNWEDLQKAPKHAMCSPQCVDSVMVGSSEHEKSEFANCSPFFKPLLMGWTRKLYSMVRNGRASRIERGEAVSRHVVYLAPCGVSLRNMEEVAEYLAETTPNIFSSLLTIDLFTFDVEVNPGRMARPNSTTPLLSPDFTGGEEDVAIGVVNALDDEPTPRMRYRRWRYTNSADIERAMNSGFCSGCTCTDGCSPETCECQRLTIQSNDRLSASLRVSHPSAKTYQHRTLEEKILSGIYECNNMCSCSKTHCLNRVVQQRIKVPIELFMTAEKGWGVRTLVDLPAGYFICTYSGELLTNEMADKAGIAVSDMYFAELDLVEIVESEKQQQGIDFIERDEDEGLGSEEGYDLSESSRPVAADIDDEEPSAIDDEFDAIHQEEIQLLRRRENEEEEEGFNAARNGEQSRFQFEKYFGENLASFTVDAQHSGNIGRFFNHSCDPNVFVQMVMVDTHDLRLPWICFFTERYIKAGKELCWNYGYSPGSVPGKVLICKCGTSNCEGRLL